MAKKIKSANKAVAASNQSINKAAASQQRTQKRGDAPSQNYWWSMSHAPRITEDTHWFQMLLIAVFGAVTIMLVQMYSYERPMNQFFWSGGQTSLSDFFSHCKMVCILICAVMAILVILYRLITQSFSIKKTIIYIPMLVYSFFVVVSYILSDYKEFALWGYNDRFEGTLVLLAYMLMLYLVINSVNTEMNVKWVIYPIGISSALLGLLGVTQALDKDFFRTALGQKLITPNGMTESGYTMNQLIDQKAAEGEQLLNFTFQNREIYQTVYNINYVSFYLTLLLPIFGLLFIMSVKKFKEVKAEKGNKAFVMPIVWGALFALLEFNLMGSASSGGFFGMAVVVLVAIILMNKKILNWVKPLAILIAITLLIGGATAERWMPEISFAVNSVTSDKGTTEQVEIEAEPTLKGQLDYIKTEGHTITVSINGETVSFNANYADPTAITIVDGEGKSLNAKINKEANAYYVEDERFDLVSVRPGSDSNGLNYLIIGTSGTDWNFAILEEGVQYYNQLGHPVDLINAPAVGFENNPGFGSGRGYIWSRTIPMMKDTVLIGHGADTYCLYFPHNDYVGKFNSPNYGHNINIVVDKPHNMYMGMWVGTGGISTIAFLALLVIYAIQSIKTFWHRRYDSFLDFVGVGIFLGIMGFAATGLVDDSTVSVMPMFYTLLGTGIAINMILGKADKPAPEITE